MLFAVLAIPAAFGRSQEPDPVDYSLIEEFQAIAPETVFLGNSLLDNRIDPDFLSDLTGINTSSLAIEGTAPGVWYLQLANIVSAVESPPEKIFVFFHDDLITRPMYFTGQKDMGLVESLVDTESTSFTSLPESAGSIADKLKNIFASIYPISTAISRRSENPVNSISAKIAGVDQTELSERSKDLFAFAPRRDQAAIIQPPKYHGTFGSKIDSSFLPLIIDQAKTIGSEIIFVRVAARPNDDGSPNEPESLAKYSADLAEYLASNNVQYVDMTAHVDEAGIDAAMYYDGYHLKQRFRQSYTESFSEWLLANQENSPGASNKGNSK